jgi:hypothetical protein
MYLLARKSEGTSGLCSRSILLAAVRMQVRTLAHISRKKACLLDGTIGLVFLLVKSCLEVAGASRFLSMFRIIYAPFDDVRSVLLPESIHIFAPSAARFARVDT